MEGSLLIFSRRDVRYGIPLANVLEIAELPEVMPSHDPIPGCIGSVSCRGYLLPVLDPASLGTDRRAAASERLVILCVDGVVFGLLLDNFVRVGQVEEVFGVAGPDGGAEAGPSYASRAIADGRGALVLLSMAPIADLVRRYFARQQFPDAPVEAERDAPEGPASLYLCARIEKVAFAIPVEHVTEIVEGHEVTPLFNAPPMLRGLINLRGQILACVDISGDFGCPLRPLLEGNQFVILQCGEADLALCVEGVTGIRRLARAKFQGSESVLEGDVGRLTSGVHEGDDGMLLILAVPAVFGAPALVPFRGAEA